DHFGAEHALEPRRHPFGVLGAQVDVVPGVLGHVALSASLPRRKNLGHMRGPRHRIAAPRPRRPVTFPLASPSIAMSRRHAFAPFRNRSFRFQWPADLLTSCAFEMETLILGWYVLVETNSVLFLTVFGALLYGGTLIAPILGVASDRVGHRNLLAGMRAIYAVVAATLMAFAFSGVLSPLLVCVMAAVTGIVRPSDMGLRGAM